jgi:hypothetical protein
MEKDREDAIAAGCSDIFKTHQQNRITYTNAEAF